MEVRRTQLTHLGECLRRPIVWQFVVKVKDDDFHHTFAARTNMTWPEFEELAYEQFTTARVDVILGYRISSEGRQWVMLICEFDWTTALIHMQEKVQMARTQAVTMELKNTVSNGLNLAIGKR
jgi:hypothetical protein